MTTIFIKFRRETELVEVSLTASRVNSQHYVCKNAEMNLKSTTIPRDSTFK